MNRYIKTFRLFFGSRPLKSPLECMAIVAFIALLALVIGAFGTSQFLDVLELSIVSVGGCSGLILLAALYSLCSPENAGYKYFRSVPDCAGQLRRAVISVNLFALVVGAAILVVTMAVFSAAGMDIGIGTVYGGAVFLLLEFSLCNFTGFVQKVSIRLAALGAGLFVCGLISGFGERASEDAASDAASDGIFPAAAIMGACVLAYVGGIIFAAAQAKRKWGGNECAE